MRDYQEYINRKRQEYGDKFSDRDLQAQYIPYYESGERIEVTITYPNGKTYVRRGTIGATTGWIPCFLLMRRSSDRSSSDTLTNPDLRITAVIRNGKRIAL
jgi:hypothetical protein